MTSLVKINQVEVKTEPNELDHKSLTQQVPIDISNGSSSSGGSISSSNSSNIDDSLLSQPTVGQNKRNSDESGGSCLTKKPKMENSGFALLPGFLSPLPPDIPEPLSVRAPETGPLAVAVAVVENRQLSQVLRAPKQFWKAGDYEGGNACDSTVSSGGFFFSTFCCLRFYCPVFCLSIYLFIILNCLTLNIVAVGMDHVRVHPKFLHSNATSHKWALGGTH